MDDEDRDALMRMAAFEQVRRLNEVNDHLTATELAPGFIFEGERVPLINPQGGIFKPQRMRYLLSIKTVLRKPCGKVWNSRPPPMTIPPRLATLSILGRQRKCRQPRHLPITSTLTLPRHPEESPEVTKIDRVPMVESVSVTMAEVPLGTMQDISPVTRAGFLLATPELIKSVPSRSAWRFFQTMMVGAPPMPVKTRSCALADWASKTIKTLADKSASIRFMMGYSSVISPSPSDPYQARAQRIRALGP